MKNTKFIFKLAAILFAIAFVCTLLLVLCNALTKDRIAQLKTESETAAKTEVLKGAKEFEPAKAEGVEESYIGKDADGNTVGYCFKVEPSGFGGKITVMVGVTTDGKVSGVKITNMSETPGLGAKCTEEAFSSQFKGFDPAQKTLAVKKDGGDVDAITASTITSRAYTNALATAVKVYATIAGTPMPLDTWTGASTQAVSEPVAEQATEEVSNQ